MDATEPVTALLVVDVQVGTLPNAQAVPADVLVDNVGRLVAAFRQASLGVVFALATGTPPGRTSYGAGGRTFPDGFADLAPGLDRRGGDPLVVRAGWSAFAADGGLATHLSALGATRLVIAGLATTFGIESTARAAYDAGLDVVVVGDAVSDPDPAGHERALTRTFPLLGLVLSTADIEAELRG